MPDADLDLLEASSPQPRESGEFEWDVPDGWQQGRGAFGGLVLAAMIRAAEAKIEADDQPLRTLNATLCAPVLAEPTAVSAEVLRAGNNTTAVDVRVRQDGEVRAHGSLFFGTNRAEDGNWSTLTPPDTLSGAEPTSFEEAEVAAMPSGMTPRFSQHFEYRPLTGGSREVTGWIRADRPGAPRDAAYLAALADAYWPAAFVAFRSPRPLATVSFSMQFLGSWSGLDPDAPLFYTAESPVAHQGYALDSRRLWGHDGRLMAVNEQNFCIIK